MGTSGVPYDQQGCPPGSCVSMITVGSKDFNSEPVFSSLSGTCTDVASGSTSTFAVSGYFASDSDPVTSITAEHGPCFTGVTGAVVIVPSDNGLYVSTLTTNESPPQTLGYTAGAAPYNLPERPLGVVQCGVGDYVVAVYGRSGAILDELCFVCGDPYLAYPPPPMLSASPPPPSTPCSIALLAAGALANVNNIRAIASFFLPSNLGSTSPATSFQTDIDSVSSITRGSITALNGKCGVDDAGETIYWVPDLVVESISGSDEQWALVDTMLALQSLDACSYDEASVHAAFDAAAAVLVEAITGDDDNASCFDRLTAGQITSLLVQGNPLTNSYLQQFDISYSPPADQYAVLHTVSQLSNTYEYERAAVDQILTVLVLKVMAGLPVNSASPTPGRRLLRTEQLPLQAIRLRTLKAPLDSYTCEELTKLSEHLETINHLLAIIVGPLITAASLIKPIVKQIAADALSRAVSAAGTAAAAAGYGTAIWHNTLVGDAADAVGLGAATAALFLPGTGTVELIGAALADVPAIIDLIVVYIDQKMGQKHCNPEPPSPSTPPPSLPPPPHSTCEYDCQCGAVKTFESEDDLIAFCTGGDFGPTCCSCAPGFSYAFCVVFGRAGCALTVGCH